MKKNLFLTVLFILAMSVISCSKDDDVLNHDLDNTVWETESTSASYVYGLIFSDGYVQEVKVDKESGRISAMYFSVKYSFDRAGGRILLYFEERRQSGESFERIEEYSYEEGSIFYGTTRYFLR